MTLIQELHAVRIDALPRDMTPDQASRARAKLARALLA